MWQLSALLALAATNLCLAAPQEVIPISKAPRRGLYGLHKFLAEKKIDFSNSVAQYGELPWTVKIFVKKMVEEENGYELKNVHHCHGALINDKAVLVSVHCVYEKKAEDVSVRVGEWDANELDRETHPIQDRNVSEIVYHSPTNPWELENMVAILILSSPVEFGKNADPVCLPQTNDEYDASQCIISGWSDTVADTEAAIDSSKLRRVKLPVINHETCQKTYAELLASTGRTVAISPTVVCADNKETLDMCKGQTGRPLVCPLKNDPERFVLVGLGVFDYGCSVTSRFPPQFVQILPDRAWIDKTMLEKQLDTSSYIC